MTTQFTTQLPKIVERVATQRRLTLLQGALLLQQYQDLETANELLRRKLEKAENDRDYHAYFANKRSEEWNELMHALDRALEGVRVYSKESDGDKPLWTVEWRGKVSKGHKSIADAYETAITDILREDKKPIQVQQITVENLNEAVEKPAREA